MSAVASTSSTTTTTAAGGGLAGLRTQFLQLPRILQVGAVAVVLVGAWTLCRTTVWQWAADATQQADALQRELDLAAARPTVDGGLRNIVIGHGPIILPEDPQKQDADSRLAMLNAYQDLVASRSRDVQKPKWSLQNSTPVGRGDSAFMPPGRTAARITAEISFESSPEVAAAVIADLESSPAIDAISSVKITGDEKGNSKMVKVRLTVESWSGGGPPSNRR